MKKVKLLEIDDENNDSITFSKSEILDSNLISTQKIKDIDEIFYNNDQEYIIDVGGNKTATIFLNEVKKIGIFENIVWFIPLTSGEQDNQNAYETYLEIKKIDQNAKVVFVLSNVKTNDIEWEFLNFFGNDYLETSLSICKKIENVDYIEVPNDPIISNCRYFNKTVYDLSRSTTDFRKLAFEVEEVEKRRKYILFNRIQNEAKMYVDVLRNKTFNQLNTILKGI